MSRKIKVRLGESILVGTTDFIPYITNEDQTWNGSAFWDGYIELFLDGGPVVELQVGSEGLRGWSVIEEDLSNGDWQVEAEKLSDELWNM